MSQANNDTPSGEEKKTPPSRQEFFLELWKDNKAVLGLLIYLYLSAVGYTYDVVYYGYGYGLSVVKYVAFDDLVFSVLKHWVVIVGSLVSLTIFGLILFIVIRIAMWLHRRRGSIRAAFGDYCRLARDSFKFLWSVIETLYEQAVRALAASLAPIASRARQLVLSVPTWLRWLFWLLTYPVHRTISIVAVGLFIILARILYYATRPIVGALRLIAPIAAPLMWAGTMLLPVVPFVLIAGFFLGPFWIASSVAQQASANPPARKITVCTRWPQECHKDLTHIGSMGKFALFTKGGEPNGKGKAGLHELLTVYLWKWPTTTTNENLVIIPLDNMSAFHGVEAPPGPRKPTAAELLERHVLPDIKSVLASLASLPEDTKNLVGPEIDKATASLPNIEKTLAALPGDPKTIVGPEIDKTTASLSKIEKTLASLPEDTKKAVMPEIDKATASLLNIEETLASLPEDTKNAVMPEIDKATASLPNIEETLASLPEDTKNAVVPEIDRATALLPNIEETLASLPEDTKKAVMPEIDKATASLLNIEETLASLPEDTKNAVMPEIDKATASLPNIEETLASLPEDTKNAVVPEIDRATALLPNIEETLASLPEDTKNAVVPEIDRATALLPNIEETLASLPEDTKNAVVPEIKKAAETIFEKVDRLAPEIPVFRHAVVERTTRRVAEVRYSLAGFAEGQHILDSRQIGWLRDVHASIVACRSAQKTPQLVLVGYASSQTFAGPLGKRSYPGLCRVDQVSKESTHNNSPLQNCYLANRRMAQVAAFLAKPFAAARDASEPVMRRLNDSCIKRNGIETIYPGLTARPWCNLVDMTEARAKNPRPSVGNQPDFFNRSVHIVVKNAGGCTPFSEDTK